MNWISIKERLPEYTDEICGNKVTGNLLVYIAGEVHEAFLEAVRPDFTTLIWSPPIEDNCEDMEKYYGGPVTHWMPMPEPPKE